ncbi:hypothetical protein ACHAW6_003579 [Cyclotella cf. meneghiniana]
MHILPALTNNSSLRLGTFADNSYYTIFHEGNKGAMVHDPNDVTMTSMKPAILQGCWDDNGLMCVPLTEPSSIFCNPTVHHINNVYHLPSTKHIVCYLHATLGFPTKTTLLSVICHGNLTSFPGLATRSEKCFPESDDA